MLYIVVMYMVLRAFFVSLLVSSFHANFIALKVDGGWTGAGCAADGR